MGAALSPSVSPVNVSFSFATVPRSPAWSSETAVGGLALHHLDVLQALARAASKILRRRVVFQHAGHHLEIADPPGEGIGQRLEHENGQRLGVADFSLHFAALAGGLAVADGRAALRRDRETFPRANRAAWRCRYCAAPKSARPGRCAWPETPRAGPFIRSSIGSVPFSKNSSISASSPSATISTSVSCATLAASARSAGISSIFGLPSPSGV